MQHTKKEDFADFLLTANKMAETTVTVRWIAERLRMGAPGYVNHLLYRLRKTPRR